MNSVRKYLEHSPLLGERVFVDPSALVLGDVQLGDDCSVWPMAVVRGDMHKIRIGDRTSVQDGSVLHITHAGPLTQTATPSSLVMTLRSDTKPCFMDAQSATVF